MQWFPVTLVHVASIKSALSNLKGRKSFALQHSQVLFCRSL